MKIFLFTLTCSLLLAVAYGQTNVSGGIFVNTTWTLVNSPYIVVDTVVIFPNVTLTIEAGVVVKFDNSVQIEIRQGQLLAIGNATDSIFFTSNSPTPTQGIYSGIYLNGGALNSTFNYCHFSYAYCGVLANISDTLIVNNSNFTLNSTGLQFTGSTVAEVALIDSCNFTDNSNGLDLEYLRSASINHCHFSYNTYGVQNHGHINSLSSLKNCVIDFNAYGFFHTSYITVDSSTIKHNQMGILSGSASLYKNCIVDSNSLFGIMTSGDSVVNCSIKYNSKGIMIYNGAIIIGNDIEYNTLANIAKNFSATSIISGNILKYSNVGIDTISGNYTITNNIIEDNNIGINLFGSSGVLNCNSICNNTSYNLNYRDVGNFDASHNYWCTDSVSTEALIYDGYDNITYGLVSFMPIDSICSPVISTSISEITYLSFTVFPNPAISIFRIKNISSKEMSLLQIVNLLGEVVYTENLLGKNESVIDVNFARGIYFVIVSDGERNIVRKLIIE